MPPMALLTVLIRDYCQLPMPFVELTFGNVSLNHSFTTEW